MQPLGVGRAPHGGQHRQSGGEDHPKIDPRVLDSRTTRDRVKTARAWGVSPDRFEGWEPRELHEHFDADGNPCRAADACTTVVTREPEWTDHSRELALRLTDYEARICGCGCNQPIDVAYDGKRAFKVDKFICYAERAKQQVMAREREDAQQSKRPEGWDYGLHYYVVPHDD